MNLPTIIDVAIGLVLMFFLLATIGSVLAEWWAAHRKLRHRLLRRTVNRLLEPENARRFWSHPLLLPLYDHPRRTVPGARDTRPQVTPPVEAQASAVAPPSPQVSAAQEPTEKAAAEAPPGKRSKKRGGVFGSLRRFAKAVDVFKVQKADAPAYLDPELFASAVLDMAAGQGAAGRLPSTPSAWEYAIRNNVPAKEGPNNDLQDRLLALLRQVPRDATDCGAQLRAAVAKWFNETMTRATGVYRRQVQKALFIIGVVLAVGLNCDAVRVAYVLFQNPALLSQVAQQATALVQENTSSEGNNAPAAANEDLKALLKSDVGQLRDLTKIGFPIGWASDWRDNFISRPDRPGAAPGIASWLAKITGLLVSAVAVCLGAPFWFDMLGRLVKLRSSAGSEGEKKKPDSTTGATPAGPAPAATSPAPVTAVGKPAVSLPSAIDALAHPGTDFAVDRAFWLAEFADHAYETDRAALNQWLGQNGFRLVEFMDVNDTQAFLAQAEGVAVLAFRGTEQKLQDWVTDAEFKLVNGRSAGVSGQVHAGFSEALAGIAERVDGLVGQLKSERVLFHVTGHSLGGALATLAALRFAHNPERACPVHTVHTFGSPRVGDADFVKDFDAHLQGRSYRIVNDEDLVTRVPPRAMAYDHVGQIIYIDEAGRLQRDIGYWYRFLNFAANAIGDLKQAVKTAVKDHGMKLYCGHLEKAAITRTVV